MLKPNHTKQGLDCDKYILQDTVMTVVLVADLKLWISGTGANANAIAIHYSGFENPVRFHTFQHFYRGVGNLPFN